jgi:hypothetical protein
MMWRERGGLNEEISRSSPIHKNSTADLQEGEEQGVQSRHFSPVAIDYKQMVKKVKETRVLKTS